MSELGPDERSDAWRAVWYVDNAVDLNECRDALRGILHNLLDYEADVALPPGKRVAGRRPQPADPAGKAGDPTDPDHYLFAERKLWIPWAQDGAKATSRGTYAKGYPRGAVIHWTAGHRHGVREGMRCCGEQGHLYLVIDQDGLVGQGFPLNHWGYHAGKSGFDGFEGTVSDELVGIEVQAAGKLRRRDGHYYPWWDQDGGTKRHRYLRKNRIPAREVVYSKARGNIERGYYHRFTPAQVLALTRTILWLRLNNPGVFHLEHVLGHDEVSPGRKADPGAALVHPQTGAVMTTAEYRSYLHGLEAEVLRRADG